MVTAAFGELARGPMNTPQLLGEDTAVIGLVITAL
jgi:hypothetical protein